MTSVSERSLSLVLGSTSAWIILAPLISVYFSMQLQTSLASEYSKAQAIDMTNQYYSTEPTKYPPSTESNVPYSLSSPQNSSDNPPSITSPPAAPTMPFPRFPYDRLDIGKPGYEPENLSTTEAFMRQYGNSAVTACQNPYAAQERLHHAVHQQAPRGFPPAGYPSPPAVMSNANPAGLPMFPWMRSSISGEL